MMPEAVTVDVKNSINAATTTTGIALTNLSAEFKYIIESLTV